MQRSYRTHYNQWCCLHCMGHDKSTHNTPQNTTNCCRVLFMTYWNDSNDFQRSLCHVQCRQTLVVVARRLVYTRCKPSFVPQTFSSFVFYPPSPSFCHRSARLMSVMCTERSLLCIMSRHTPYCWLATSLFWYWARFFSKAFLKKYITHL